MMIANRNGTFKPFTVQDILKESGDLGWQGSGSLGYYSHPQRVDVIPDWVERVEGYAAQVFICMKRPEIYVVNQVPTSTLGVGYSNVVIVGKDGKPFKQMKPLLKKFAKELEKENSGYVANRRLYKVDDDGKFTGPFGLLDSHDVDGIIQKILPYYEDWSQFPDAKSWSMVEKLKSAMESVNVLRREMRTKELEGEINQAREAIKNMQERIQILEKHQNEMYEKAADGMNLLEEHGVKVDLEEKEKDEDVDFDGIPISSSWSPISTARPGIFVPNEYNDLCTVSASDRIPIHFDPEQMKQLREEIAKGIVDEFGKQGLVPGSSSDAWDVQYTAQ